MRRRLLLLLILAVLAATATYFATSAASFTTASSTTVRAATAPLSSDTLRVRAGDGQTATADTAVATAPSVVVTDTGGNPVSGVAVTFAVASGGGAVTEASATTDDSGAATAGSWTLGPSAGVNSLTATAAGVGGSPVTFTATGVAAAASTIALNAGNGQSAVAGAAVTTDPSVLVTDAGGDPVSGVEITFAVASGGGAVTPATVTTDGSGVATVTSWTLGTTAGANTLTATAFGLSGSPVTFSATSTAGTASRYVVTSSTYSPIGGATAAISAQLADQYGNAVKTPGISVTWSRTPTSGALSASSSSTNANGIATVTLTTSTTAGVAYTVTATSSSPTKRTGASAVITTVAGAATKMALNAGGGQTAVAGQAVATDPSVVVRDVNNNPVPGVAVTFAVASGGGSVSGGSATTNVSGIATVTSWTLGTTAGVNTLRATVSGLSGSPVTFTATGVAGAAGRFAVNGGDGQTAVVNVAVLTDPSVRVTDANGNPVSGVSVTFAVASGGGSATGASQTTNSSGVATVTSWKLGTIAGANTLTATAAGLTGSPVTFTATGIAGSATKYLVTADDTTPAAGSTVTLIARLVDAYSNPVSTGNVRVNWTKPTGSGGSWGSQTTYTDASGLATTTYTVSTGSARTYVFTATSSSPTRTGSVSVTTH
jgi:adhesin/invasin